MKPKLPPPTRTQEVAMMWDAAEQEVREFLRLVQARQH